MSTLLQLFQDESGGDGADATAGADFHINKSYAKAFEQFKRKDEIQRLQHKLGNIDDYASGSGSDSSDSSSGEDSDDEVAKPTGRMGAHFLQVLEAVRAGKAKDLEGVDNKFYTDKENKIKKKKEQSYSVNDYTRDQNIKLQDGAENFHECREPDRPKNMTGQRLVFGDSDEEEEDGDEDDEDAATAGEATTQDPPAGEYSREELERRLTAALYRPDMTEEDRRLAKFFIKHNNRVGLSSDSDASSSDDDADHPPPQQQQQPPPQEEDMHGFVYDDAPTAVHTIATLATQSGESSTHRPTSYPAKISSTLRVQDKRRQDARTRTKERKLAEKQKLRQEVHKLMALKREELLEKLAKIQKVSGQEKLAFGEHELDEDFNPALHDAVMEEMYNEGYYEGSGGKGDKHKPVFDYDEEIDGEVENYDDYVCRGDDNDDHDSDEGSDEEALGGDDDKHKQQQRQKSATTGEELSATLAPSSSGRVIKKGGRKGRRRSALAQALQRKKPLFDSTIHNFDEYYDQYYGLDFEDVVGGMKCRYNYKKVEPNSFGLTAEEILSADDAELNRWYSLPKLLRSDRTAQMEVRDRKIYSVKANNEVYKKKIFPSLYEEEQKETDAADATVLDEATAQKAEEERKKKKNLKKKLRRQMKADGTSASAGDGCATGNSKDGKRKQEAVQETDQSFEEPKKKQNREKVNQKVESVGKLNTSKNQLEVNTLSKTEKLTLRKKKMNEIMKVRRLNKAVYRTREEKHEIRKQIKKEKKERTLLDVGDATSTVMKLSRTKLSAYNLQPSTVKRDAKFSDQKKKEGQEGKQRKPGSKAGKSHEKTHKKKLQGKSGKIRGWKAQGKNRRQTQEQQKNQTQQQQGS